MNKFVITTLAAATIGLSALAAAPASAAVSVDPIVKTETTNVKEGNSNLVKVARRGGRRGFRGRGFRGRGFHRGGRFHRRHRWHRWYRYGGYYPGYYYPRCFNKKIWTYYGPVWKRICRY